MPYPPYGGFIFFNGYGDLGIIGFIRTHHADWIETDETLPYFSVLSGRFFCMYIHALKDAVLRHGADKIF